MKIQWLSKEQENSIKNWLDLKYGMFIHYGLFSVCGGVWNGKRVEIGYSEQILSHGDIPQIDYENLAKTFTADAFDAKEIVKLAKDSKMNYIVFVSKHHDGFCLFDTKTTSYNCAQSPCHRDLVKELATECQNAGLKFGLYFSWIDWHYPLALPISLHNSDPIPPEHMKYNLEQLTELLSNYGPICELWMDMGAPTYEQSKIVYELAHRLQPQIMVNGRVWNDFGDFVTMPDNTLPDCNLDVPWQTPATVYHATWGYRSWQERSNLEQKIQDISSNIKKVVSNGGNYLLNIGPMGDGSIVPFEKEVLLGIGKIIDKEGFATKENDANAKQLSELCPSNGMALHRYSGAEYYSLHKIITGYCWNVLISEEGNYIVEYELDDKLEKECKLCLDTNDDSFVFSMKQGKKSLGICSSVHLKSGLQRIMLYTPGEPRQRSEFPLKDFTIKFILSQG